MFIFSDFIFLPLLLWLAAWRLLGDRNGWLALANAWAWWLLGGAIPAGAAVLWPRSRLASLVWGIGAGVIWQKKYGWTLPLGKEGYGFSRIEGIGTDFEIDVGLSRQRSMHRDVTTFSLLTFNLLNDRRDLTPVVELAAREAPDLLLFQECIESHAAQLENGLASCYPHRLWLPAAEFGMGFGIAARLPFALTGVWAYPNFEPFAARFTLVFPHPHLTGAHTDADCRASALCCAPVRCGTTLDVYCVQFISPTNEVRRVGPTGLLHLRQRQIDWVLGEIGRRQNAALVAGDWNTTEGTGAYRRAVSDLVDGWREAGRGPGWSWPHSLPPFVKRSMPPLLRLDYLMHTGRRFGAGVTVAEMRVVRDDLGSDHCPLLARLELDQISADRFRS